MWKIKPRKRPEETGDARKYYDSEAGGAYAQSHAIERIQRELTLKALSIALFPFGSKILDAGCGSGYSLEILKAVGYETAGFDISLAMVRLSKGKGFNAKVGDLRKIPFPAKSFDGIISISALQWVSLEESGKVAAEFKRVLRPKGRAVVQFYPKSEEELLDWGRTFRKAGFGVVVKQEGLDSRTKRRVFLALSKKGF